MGTQRNEIQAPWAILDKSAVWSRPDSDWIYSTRISFIDNLQNKSLKYKWKNYTQGYYWFAKTFLNLIFIWYHMSKSITIVTALTSGANLNMVGAYYAVSLYTNKSVFRYVNTYCILFSNGNMTELTGNTTATLVLYTL